MKKRFNKKLLSVAIIASLSFAANAEVNDYNKSYEVKDIEERYVENPYALFIRADKIMKSKEPDYSKALALFEKASKLGIAEASHNAGFIYHNGLGNVKKDPSKAAAMFLIGAKAGVVDSQMMLGHAFISGESLKVNTEQAYKWFYKAAKAGVLEAKYYVANMIFYGKGTSMDTDLGLKLLDEVAEETKNRKIYFELGEIYRKGINNPRNYELALINYEKSANLGFIKSQTEAAEMYKYGKGTKVNNEKALYWYTKAALQSDKDSISAVGDMHLRGEGTEKDLKMAEDWYMKGAEMLDAHSLYQLASIYMKNEHGVEPNYNKAIDFYHKAVNAGNKEAMRELAMIYRKGIDGVLESDNFKYTDLMNLYYKDEPKIKQEAYNMFVFEDDQKRRLEMKKKFHKQSFEQHLK